MNNILKKTYIIFLCCSIVSQSMGITTFASENEYSEIIQTTNTSDENMIVVFEDENLKKLLNEEYFNQPADANITRKKMKELGIFHVFGNQFTSLKGLEYGTNIFYMTIRHTLIEDISPIASLNNLRELYLNNNQIVDTTPLTKLNNLRYVVLDHNLIEDISILRQMTFGQGGTSAVFANNKISDLCPIVGWKQSDGSPLVIDSLNFNNNKISDISCLENLYYELDLSHGRFELAGNSISDISVLSLPDFPQYYVMDLQDQEIILPSFDIYRTEDNLQEIETIFDIGEFVLTEEDFVWEDNKNVELVTNDKLLLKSNSEDDFYLNLLRPHINENWKWVKYSGVIKQSNRYGIPVFYGTENKELQLGDSFDEKDGVSVKFYDDDKTTDMQILGSVDINKPGIYTLVYSVSDQFGNIASTERTIEVKQPLIGMNRAPEIELVTKEVTLKENAIFDPKAWATAKDHEDGNLTEALEVVTNTVDTSQAGTYEVKYKVTDSGGATAKATMQVIVDGVPTIIGAEDVTIEVGAAFDVLAGVTATDKEDGELTAEIEVVGTVDISRAGTYEVKYKVTDSIGNTTEVVRTIEVKQPLIGMNRAPEIELVTKEVTLKENAIFDPKAWATAKDHEDGNLTEALEVVTNTVDTSQAGTYEVKYKVTDSGGATAKATMQVIVDGVPTIIGAEDVTIEVGAAFDVLAGVTATDKEDGELTAEIEVVGTVDISRAGTYEVKYKVTDSIGNTTEVVRTIKTTGKIEVNDDNKANKQDTIITNDKSVLPETGESLFENMVSLGGIVVCIAIFILLGKDDKGTKPSKKS